MIHSHYLYDFFELYIINPLHSFLQFVQAILDYSFGITVDSDLFALVITLACVFVYIFISYWLLRLILCFVCFLFKLFFGGA